MAFFADTWDVVPRDETRTSMAQTRKMRRITVSSPPFVSDV